MQEFIFEISWKIHIMFTEICEKTGDYGNNVVLMHIAVCDNSFPVRFI